MLGLRIALSVAKGVIDEIGGLLSKLARRSTYSENLADSRAVVSDIDSYDLLDKATILLTPTATSDARVHSVKTYTGDELVTNGDFSDGSNGWFVTNGNVTDKYNASMTAYQSGIKITPFNKTGTYRVTFDLVVTSGSCKFDAGGGNDEIFSTSGSKTIYVTNTLKFEFNAFNLGWVGSLDNVSVVDVSSDFDFDRASSATRINSSGLVQDMQSITDPELVLNGDFEELGDELITNGSFDTDSNWTKGTGWSIANGKASCDGSQASDTLIYENIGDQSNETIKFSFTVSDYVSGTLKTAVFGASGTTVHSITSNGDYTFYIDVASGHNGNTGFKAEVGFQGSIDNVSVQKVDPNDRWTLGTGWSIEDGVATCDGTQTSISSLTTTSGLSIQNKLVEVIFDLTRTAGSLTVTLQGTGSNDLSNLDSNGTYSFLATSVDSTSQLLFKANTDFIGTIDNVSVKDITFSDDVDLARINYDSNGDNGHILLEPTSTNLITYSEDFSDSSWSKQSNITPTYNTTETLSPDGTYNATKFVGNGSDGVFVQASVTGVITRSVYLKSVTGTTNVVLKDPVLTQTAKTLTLNETWQRYDLSESNQHGSLSGLWIDDIPSSGIYMWGTQIEALPYATSYIPTLTGSTVTRATETLTGSGNSTLINSTEGVLYAEIAGLVDADTIDRTISLSDNTTTNRVEMKLEGSDSGSIKGRFDSAADDITLTESGVTASNFNKIALVWSSGKCALFINGVKEQEDLTFNTFASDVLFDLSFKSPYNDVDGSRNFHGKVKALAVFNEALTDDELELLTGVTNYGSFGELASANGYTII